MNINQRISELGPGGLPRYNKKCNELTRAVNWLLGMTTSGGKVISDGGRGPVIPTGVGAGAVTGPQPWLTDPAGNTAGWEEITSPDITNLDLPTTWTWTGQKPTGNFGGGWMKDNFGNEAAWVQGLQAIINQVPYNIILWGTATPTDGQGVPAQCGTETTIQYIDQVVTATTLTDSFNGSGLNAVYPALCTPAFLMQCFADASPGPIHQPFFSLNGFGGGASDVTISFTHQITYDGFSLVQSTGTALIHADPGPVVFQLNEPIMDWTYDASIPGYLAEYTGVPSSNPNPVVKEILTISQPLFSIGYIPGGIEAQYFGIQFLTYFSNP